MGTANGPTPPSLERDCRVMQRYSTHAHTMEHKAVFVCTFVIVEHRQELNLQIYEVGVLANWWCRKSALVVLLAFGFHFPAFG
jgi:hypothetical protein